MGAAFPQENSLSHNIYIHIYEYYVYDVYIMCVFNIICKLFLGLGAELKSFCQARGMLFS